MTFEEVQFLFWMFVIIGTVGVICAILWPEEW